MTDLYAALNIERTASPEVVRSAYRKMSKTAHPDTKTGSPKKWAAVATAVAVLSDPDRRKHYDETGKIDEPPPDNAEAEALQFAMHTIEAVIEQATRYWGDPSKCDVIADAKKLLREQIGALIREMATAETRVVQTQKLAKRFTVKKDKPNRITPMLEAKAAGLRDGIAKAEARKRMGERALEIVSDHEFAWSG